MADTSDRPLTEADKEIVFRKATGGLLRKYGVAVEEGMTDAELAAALKTVFGIFGGSGGPDQLSIAYAGAGLRIWGAWHAVNTVQDTPLFAGDRTIAMARHIYGIGNPDEAQMRLI